MRNKRFIPILLSCAILLTSCGNTIKPQAVKSKITKDKIYTAEIRSELSTQNIPPYKNKPYTTINNNKPYFSKVDKKTKKVFEVYSSLDNLGRCGTAYANVCKKTMPETERDYIGNVKPTGWHTIKYNGYIEGNYLYNRCHLIGYQLTGENANEKNLITGTRYLNCDGQLPFEDKVADYVKKTNNHVLYRVTPMFKHNNLVASGVLMEAYSVEDKGKGCQFCVYCYNVQPGIKIDYETGESKLIENYKGKYATSSYFSDKYNSNNTQTDTNCNVSGDHKGYIININTKKIHTLTCRYSKSGNIKKISNMSINDLLTQGYVKCKVCNPE